jgi:hypothetical protein
MTRARGHNQGVSGIGSVAPRLVVVALLALGLVGMHHLVVVACHHAAEHSAHASTATPSGVLSMDAHAAHADYASDLAAQAPMSPQPPADEPSGLVAVAATCLAILLMLVGLVLPHMLARVRRWHMSRVTILEQWVSTSPVRPPDLNLLSVSRT